MILLPVLPEMTRSRPAFTPSNPSSATFVGAAFSPRPSALVSMPARCQKFVSTSPGKSRVKEMPLSLFSALMASTREIRNALVPPYRRTCVSVAFEGVRLQQWSFGPASQTMWCYPIFAIRPYSS